MKLDVTVVSGPGTELNFVKIYFHDMSIILLSDEKTELFFFKLGAELNKMNHTHFDTFMPFYVLRRCASEICRSRLRQESTGVHKQELHLHCPLRKLLLFFHFVEQNSRLKQDYSICLEFEEGSFDIENGRMREID